MRARNAPAPQKRPGKATRVVLLAVMSVTVLGFAAFVALAAVWERVHWGRNGAWPGELRVYAPSEFGSADEEEA